MSNLLKVPGVQTDIQLKNVSANLQLMSDAVAEPARHGAQLVVFPECALTGYCFDSLAEALPFAESVDGPSIQAMIDVCRQSNTHAVFGFLERDDERLFNALALTGPSGLVGS